MKRKDENINIGVSSNKRKFIVYITLGLAFGLCVGYSMAKFAHWLMNLN